MSLQALGPFEFALMAALPWTLLWKGIALWKAARRGHQAWFIVLLLVHTLGLLEILYIFVFCKRDKSALTL